MSSTEETGPKTTAHAVEPKNVITELTSCRDNASWVNSSWCCSRNTSKESVLWWIHLFRPEEKKCSHFKINTILLIFEDIKIHITNHEDSTTVSPAHGIGRTDVKWTSHIPTSFLCLQKSTRPHTPSHTKTLQCCGILLATIAAIAAAAAECEVWSVDFVHTCMLVSHRAEVLFENAILPLGFLLSTQCHPQSRRVT